MSHSRRPLADRVKGRGMSLLASRLPKARPLDAVGMTIANVAGRIDADLSAQGARTGPFDTLIAAQALVRALILVTHTMREFGRVAGLWTEDWENAG